MRYLVTIQRPNLVRQFEFRNLYVTYRFLRGVRVTWYGGGPVEIKHLKSPAAGYEMLCRFGDLVVHPLTPSNGARRDKLWLTGRTRENAAQEV